ncbi:MAG: flagellar protein FliS [Rickettsiaceae bacterium]|nr:flagellar protein FliS [Rickettsiaceae bacterium]
MNYADTIKKYQQTFATGRTTQELMVMVLEKCSNHIKNAKKALEAKDYVTLGKNIVNAVEITKNLAKMVIVKDSVPGSAELLKIYDNISYLLENLISSKAPPSAFDQFIYFFDSMKNMVKNMDANSLNKVASSTSTNFASSQDAQARVENNPEKTLETKLELIS